VPRAPEEKKQTLFESYLVYFHALLSRSGTLGTNIEGGQPDVEGQVGQVGSLSKKIRISKP
jgi:hypothetical protein